MGHFYGAIPRIVLYMCHLIDAMTGERNIVLCKSIRCLHLDRFVQFRCTRAHSFVTNRTLYAVLQQPGRIFIVKYSDRRRTTDILCELWRAVKSL